MTVNEPVRYPVVFPSGQKTRPWSNSTIVVFQGNGKIPHGSLVEVGSSLVDIEEFWSRAAAATAGADGRDARGGISSPLNWTTLSSVFACSSLFLLILVIVLLHRNAA